MEGLISDASYLGEKLTLNLKATTMRHHTTMTPGPHGGGGETTRAHDDNHDTATIPGHTTAAATPARRLLGRNFFASYMLLFFIDIFNTLDLSYYLRQHSGGNNRSVIHTQWQQTGRQGQGKELERG